MDNEGFRQLVLQRQTGASAGAPAAATAAAAAQPAATPARAGKGDGKHGSKPHSRPRPHHQQQHKQQQHQHQQQQQQSQYRDRAAERREGLLGDDLAAVLGIDVEALSNEERALLGGDVSTTHLVRGLDLALLERVKSEQARQQDQRGDAESAGALRESASGAEAVVQPQQQQQQHEQPQHALAATKSAAAAAAAPAATAATGVPAAGDAALPTFVTELGASVLRAITKHDAGANRTDCRRVTYHYTLAQGAEATPTRVVRARADADADEPETLGVVSRVPPAVLEQVAHVIQFGKIVRHAKNAQAPAPSSSLAPAQARADASSDANARAAAEAKTVPPKPVLADPGESIFQTADDEYVPSDAPAEAIALPAPRRAPADSFGDMFAAGGGGGDGGGGGSEDALGPVAGPAPPPADGDVGHAYGFYDADVVSSIAAKPVAAAPHAPGRPASTTHGAASSSGASGVGAHVRSLSAQEARDRGLTTVFARSDDALRPRDAPAASTGRTSARGARPAAGDADDYAECYPSTFGNLGGAGGDASEEEDLDKMDTNRRRMQRWDFETQEEFEEYKASQEAIPKMAFQFGVKKEDGRKSRKEVARAESKIHSQVQKIERLLEKRAKASEAAAPSGKRQQSVAENLLFGDRSSRGR